MPFIANILKHKSLSIVGLEKNTGKTVCLNYILNRLNQLGTHVGVTSIGVDGEQVDSVFATAKPEITLFRGTHFITSEKHYLIRQAVSKLVAVDSQRTSLGPLVTAEVLIQGQIQSFDRLGVDLSIVDGALSRLSLASPTVTEAMILATGAAVSANVKQLISKTRHLYQFICLDEVEEPLRGTLSNIETGLWAIDSDGQVHDLGITSVFLIDRAEKDILRFGHTLFAAGAISDRLLKILSAKGKDIILIARDFTKIFVTPEVYTEYTRRGNRLMVLQRSKLIAITLNPTSPQGFLLDSKSTCDALSDALQTPVYDVKKIDQ